MKQKPMETFVCPECGASFRRLASQITAAKPKCSKRCAYAAMKALHGANSPAWRGGRGTVNTLGYVVHTVRKKVLLEHRVIMEAHLGRPLEPNEVVHHINGIKSDNRIDNLVLCRTQAEHVSEHHAPGSKRTTCRYCDAPEWANGLCQTHHSRARRGIPMDRPILKRHRSSRPRT